MLRKRITLVVAVLAAVFIFGAVTAEGAWYWNAWYWNAWYWNAEADGEGVDLRTAWKVVDDQTNQEIDGDEYNYHTKIKIKVPEGTGFSLVERAETETVKLKADEDLECKANGIEAEVRYKVKPLDGAQGNLVVVWITANGQEIGHATGELNEMIELDLLIPAPEGVTPSCYSTGDDDEDD